MRYRLFNGPLAQEVLENALGDLLAAITAYDNDQAGGVPRPRPKHDVFSKPASPSDLTGLRVIDAARLLAASPTGADYFLASLDGNPIRHALKDAVRRIGQELWHLGGLTLMIATAERVAAHPVDRPGCVSRDRDSSHYHAIVNSAWNGIGGWLASNPVAVGSEARMPTTPCRAAVLRRHMLALCALAPARRSIAAWAGAFLCGERGLTLTPIRD